MTDHSGSLILTWHIAASEAREGSAAEIEPAHLMMALTTLSEMDVGALDREDASISPELRRELEVDAGALRAIFSRSGVERTRLRRRLRALVAEPARPKTVGMMHRSTESREKFGQAERIASREAALSFGPVHLLRALLEDPSPPWLELLGRAGLTDGLERLSAEAQSPTLHARSDSADSIRIRGRTGGCQHYPTPESVRAGFDAGCARGETPAGDWAPGGDAPHRRQVPARCAVLCGPPPGQASADRRVPELIG